MQIDLFWLIGNIIGGLLILITFGFIIWASFHTFDSYDAPKAAYVWGGIGALFVQLIISGFWNFPFNMQYHSFRPVSGVVSSINSRLVDTGNYSTETKYVITFKGSPQPYGLTDTRGAAIKVGDTVGLKCERTWQYASVSGYDCRYNSIGV